MTTSGTEKTAYLFPAFGVEYSGHERGLDFLSNSLDEYSRRAAEIVDFDVESFDYVNDGACDEELQSQYACYILSCCASDGIRDRYPGYCVAGYSMGLYAALYHSRAIGFGDGLRIIQVVYNSIRKMMSGKPFSVASVVGLLRRDVAELSISGGYAVEVINTNNPYNHIVAGSSIDIGNFLAAAEAVGAMNTRILPFSAPYHTSFVGEAVPELRSFFDKIPFSTPVVPLISTVDGTPLTEASSARDEVIRNIHHSIDWNRTMVGMAADGVRCFIECGPGHSLQRMSRLMDVDCRVLPLHKLSSI